MAADMGVAFLGKLPLDPRIGWCCDQGKSFLSEVPDSPAAKAYQEIIQSELKFEFHPISLLFTPNVFSAEIIDSCTGHPILAKETVDAER